MRSQLWQEFKAFAFKGNMIDLAIAVVIGAAFSGVINSLVNDLLMPSISYVTTAAKSGVESATSVAEKSVSAVGVPVQPTNSPSGEAQANQAPASAAAPPPAAAPADNKPVDFSWTIGRIRIGNFIAQLINFLLVAFAVFITMVKLLGSVMKKAAGSTPAPSEPTTKECPMCLSIIPIRAKKCAHCTADLG